MLKKNFKIFIRLVFFLMWVVTFIGFRKLESVESEKFKKNIETILRNEVNASNSYAISKIIADFERMNFLKCASLTEVSLNKRIFYNTLHTNNCKTIFKSFLSTQILTGINGLEYELKYYSSINMFAYLLEAFIYIFIFLNIILLPSVVENKLQEFHIKNSILEFEKKNITELAKQVSHDIVSPLSSMRLMVSLLRNIDPEIKQILNNSVQRTIQIVEAFKNDQMQVSMFPVKNMLDIVLKEKKSIWQDRCQILDNLGSCVDFLVVGNQGEIERVVSNILDNAYEATVSVDNAIVDLTLQYTDKQCEIIISDNGCGIKEEVLASLGATQISYGKLNHPTSGGGIGVYNAFKIISKYNGKIFYESKINYGTKVKIYLSKFQ